MKKYFTFQEIFNIDYTILQFQTMNKSIICSDRFYAGQHIFRGHNKLAKFENHKTNFESFSQKLRLGSFKL